MSDMYSLEVGADLLDRQRKCNILSEIIADLESAVQNMNNAKKQLPDFLVGESADALSTALEKQVLQLQSSIFAINTILKGV